MTTRSTKALWQQLRAAPCVDDPHRIGAFVEDLRQNWRKAGLADDAIAVLDEPAAANFVGSVMACSRYLSMMLLQDATRAHRVLTSDPDESMGRHRDELAAALDEPLPFKSCMSALRRFKAEAALTIALADLGGIWPIMRATDALARTADAATRAAVAYLFREAVRKGEWVPDDPDRAAPECASGYIVLAMGKHGANELNYSSDIDLIVFYELDQARVRDGLAPSGFFVKLTRDLVRLLNERTPDGYVFRTDLRLRPDPGATQVAISTDSALHYYESFGQNWERAAMIKARPVAGDIGAGIRLLRELSPFIWRKYLDFAAIADIHAMKRQIHAHRGFAKVAVAGHNIKLGRGGIREIEFFTQTQQLIAGGRQPELRTRQTLETMRGLAERGWITDEACAEMSEAYEFLRAIEHRIQMVADEQTHQLPTDETALASLANFAGFATLTDFSKALLRRLETVQRHYSALFEDGPELSSATANLVLAGEDDDPDTLASLAAMGFSQPEQVLRTIRSWHRGRYAAVRSEGARARLTEVQPLLVEALSQTVNPDAALTGFDRFLSSLPAGVQLFALLKAHPELMRLVALIMGSAPRLAQILSSRRRVFDAVLDPRIMGTLPTEPEVRELIEQELSGAPGLEAVLDRARIIGREQMFLIGIRLLTGAIEADQAGPAYTLIAEELIRHLHGAVSADFARRHGEVSGGCSCVLAMGRLGGYEMTASSDLDLIVVYDFDAEVKESSGAKPLAVSQYYARLTQRFISALSAPTAEGRLYEVDMRLRPSGNKGPVATQLSSFEDYQRDHAWTWEHMALT
ncbi:MAG: bifunctional [glutamine synthetase] adenylyltransferase/[glutamine synthetase]-adenylyl-L-tyrosine phosphorylase, partial [Alphaproteobacteria bacterium]|nr:bifunctional [glutamine synthetase] adenylyltransferase/[glutamine synthetase]-adenylyl-L-tyrosine phosphorylase [Alphaproteobacteria bacterium]